MEILFGHPSAWAVVLALLAVGYLLIFALCRASARASRMEERIERHRTPRVYELDDGKLALAMGRAERQHELELQAARARRHHETLRRGQRLDAGEVPPPKGAA